MNKINTFSLYLIISAFLIFVGTNYYHQQYKRHDLTYSKIVAGVTTKFSTEKAPTSTVMENDDYVIFEERAILIVLLFACALLLTAIGLNIYSHIKLSKNKINFPLIFASGLIIVLILHTTYKAGLFVHA